MDGSTSLILSFVEMGGLFAPIAFILFHIVRQFLFIPVVVVCLAGGLLFGSVFGIIFSIIGLTLSSVLLFFILRIFPTVHSKLHHIKLKWFGPYMNLTRGQIALLKLIPFMHFQLLSYCLLERNPDFRDYVVNSLYTNIPVVVFYTVFGQFFNHFSPTMAVMFLLALSALIVLLREKFIVIKWQDFF
ncbi:TVP38/TMEM64 family protein [Bacillus andreraoultii]|uniref:TVP38/TMEM64 family protein n=1 Tax=Bacillus andreraoultii TaxID=1499685 RepID=UPI00053A0A35|nr:VTT domain-containing protein [Bacillus andreraoultii]